MSFALRPDVWTRIGGFCEDYRGYGGQVAGGILKPGDEVVVHGVVASPGWTGDETLDPVALLSGE